MAKLFWAKLLNYIFVYYKIVLPKMVLP